jgi:hypothetical protein
MLPGSLPAAAPSGRIAKVLVHYLDTAGRHTLSPSLYERDAYQAYLREHPDKIDNARFDVSWSVQPRSLTNVVLRLEARGSKDPRVLKLETPLSRRPWYNPWSSVTLDPKVFREIGEIVAWRATLWQGETLLAEQKSFLW